jgi:signal transduction histidine kinase
LGVSLLLAGAAVLPARQRFPVGVLAATFTATLAYWSLGYPRGPVFASLIVAFVSAVVHGHRRAALAGVVAGCVAFPWLGYALGRADPPNPAYVVFLPAWLIALLSVAEMLRSRREQAREATRTHAEASRRRASEERMRMAQELHDVVAHNMSLINLQAGVAVHLADEHTDPRVRAALAAIKEASKSALVELRSILGVLRQVDENAPRAPTPGLRQLPVVIANAAAAGVDVRVESSYEPERLPRSVDLAAFRIVQESLTNVIRHADHGEAVVRIRAHDDVLTVEVLDEGCGHARERAVTDGGHGIIGMRERAESIGGRLEAGPRPGRGFQVRAGLPLGSHR